jgi:hypothetical protein
MKRKQTFLRICAGEKLPPRGCRATLDSDPGNVIAREAADEESRRIDPRRRQSEPVTATAAKPDALSINRNRPFNFVTRTTLIKRV